MESPLSNKENVTLQVRNEKNSGVVSFTKENRKGEPLKNAKFALYRLICSDPSHGGKHDKDPVSYTHLIANLGGAYVDRYDHPADYGSLGKTR